VTRNYGFSLQKLYISHLILHKKEIEISLTVDFMISGKINDALSNVHFTRQGSYATAIEDISLVEKEQ
jgi:hypothetical protein